VEHTTGQAIDFIEKCFGASQLSNGGLNVSVVCPHCSSKTDNLQKKKLVIKTDDFLVHCWVCGYRSGSLLDLLKRYHPHFIQEYISKFRQKQKFALASGINLAEKLSNSTKPLELKQVTLPIGFTMLAPNLHKNNKQIKMAWNYLKARNVTETDLWLWKIGITEHRPEKDSGQLDYRFRIIIPSFDCEGKLNFFSARKYWDKWNGPKYSNPNNPREEIVFNELNIDWTKELMITEGVFDLVKATENATTLLGSDLDENYLLFQKIVAHETPVMLALDNDAKVKTLKLAKKFLEYGISTRKYEIPNKYNDLGQMTKQEVKDSCVNAKNVNLNNLLFWKLKEKSW
jgi:hypothetical protein